MKWKGADLSLDSKFVRRAACCLGFLAMLLPGGLAQAAEPSCTGTEMPQAPGATSIVVNAAKIIFNGCQRATDLLTCELVYVRTAPGAADIAYDMRAYPFATKLVDTFLVEHPQTRGYFRNRVGDVEERVNLAQGEWACYFQEFNQGTEKDEYFNKITTARLVFQRTNDGSSISGPVR